MHLRPQPGNQAEAACFYQHLNYVNYEKDAMSDGSFDDDGLCMGTAEKAIFKAC